jgi:hypothetical protein
MLTRSLHVREAFPDDLTAVRTIAAANGMPNYEWPWGGAWGAVAELDGEVIAFCAGRDIPKGIFLEDLWAIDGADGRRAIAELNKWIEAAALQASRKIGGPIKLGAVVLLDNQAQRNVMLRRDYKRYAEILVKEVG